MNILQQARWFFHAVCFSLFLAACQVTDISDDVIITIEPEYAVALFEQRDAADGSPTFGLWMERMLNSECPGYGIETEVAVSAGGIFVTILGVLPPAVPCVGDSTPARQFVAIGNLADGVYPFTLSLRDVVANKGILAVANGRYELSLPDAQGIEVQEFVLEHLPEGMIWGYAATPNESSQPVADDFIANLKTISAENGLAPGYYSYFTVTGTNDIYLHNRILPSGSARFFVRRLTASRDALKSLLQNYRTAAQQPLSIHCWTTEGEL